MELARIRWATRRGMWELDLLLQPFFDNQFAKLTPAEQTTFVRLLECTDPELFSWLMGHIICEDHDLNALVQDIREYAKTHPHSS